MKFSKISLFIPGDSLRIYSPPYAKLYFPVDLPQPCSSVVRAPP